MDLFSILRREHDVIRERVEASLDADDPAEKKRQFEEARRLTRAHHLGEEIVLYARTKDVPALRDSSLEALEEHHYIAVMLDDLHGLDPGAERFAAKLGVFEEFLEHHFEEEEQEHFPAFAEALDEAVQAELAERYRAEKPDLLAEA